MQRKTDRSDAARLIDAAQIAEAVGLDVRTGFVPVAENYFGRINLAAILTAIDEVKGTHAPAPPKLKKDELAQRARRLSQQRLVTGAGAPGRQCR